MLIYQELVITLKTNLDPKGEEKTNTGKASKKQMNNLDDEGHENINESYIHKKIDKICNIPVKHKIKFNHQEYHLVP